MQTNAPEPHGPAALRGRLELGDALVFLYALVFARQYLWVVPGNALAWGLSVPVAAAAWYFYVRTKPDAPERTGREFWLLVALPLLFVYALRLPFPDTSYDVLNYRLLHAERSLRGTLFAAGDFFPAPVPFNPAPDTVTGLFRHALGYRLGTVFNLLALLWSAQIVERLLRPAVERAWPRAACVLLVMLAEHLLFEVNTYMIDLLALPLLLEATRLSLGVAEGQGRASTYARVALLAGMSAAFKLSNLAGALPLVVLCAWFGLAGPRRLAGRELTRTAVYSFVLFVAPLVPFAVYMYAEAGNPFLPFFNGLFKSPYWPTHGGWDARWGPESLWQTIVWPVLVLFRPERHSELALYSGRVSLGFVVALAGLALARSEARVRLLCLIFLLSCLSWSAAGLGYGRYGLHLELLAGIVVVVVAAKLLGERASAPWKPAAAYLFAAALVVQAAAACYLVKDYEWSMRPTALSDWDSYRHEARFLLRDRSLPPFLGAEERAALGGVRVWADACQKSNGFEVLLDAGAPILGVRHHEYFSTRESLRRFVTEVTQSEAASSFALCLPGDVAAARVVAEVRGLQVVGVRPLSLPFFSSRGRIGMMLVEISRPRDPAALAKFEQFWSRSPFPDYDYRAEITTAGAPASMRAGERRELVFEVRNLGGATWPSRGEHGRYQVNIGDRWLDAGTDRVVNDMDARTALAADLPPGAGVTLTLAVTAPAAPGDYVLEIDMVHEGLTFFREKGSTPLRLPVRVQ